MNLMDGKSLGSWTCQCRRYRADWKPIKPHGSSVGDLEAGISAKRKGSCSPRQKPFNSWLSEPEKTPYRRPTAIGSYRPTARVPLDLLSESTSCYNWQSRRTTPLAPLELLEFIRLPDILWETSFRADAKLDSGHANQPFLPGKTCLKRDRHSRPNWHWKMGPCLTVKLLGQEGQPLEKSSSIRR